jgi:hypothetical protein
VPLPQHRHGDFVQEEGIENVKSKCDHSHGPCVAPQKVKDHAFE